MWSATRSTALTVLGAMLPCLLGGLYVEGLARAMGNCKLHLPDVSYNVALENIRTILVTTMMSR